MKIIDSAKNFVKDHKAETLVAVATGVAVAAAVANMMAHKNCINVTKSLVEELSGGDYVRFTKRGQEYVIALYEYKPEEFV